VVDIDSTSLTWATATIYGGYVNGQDVLDLPGDWGLTEQWNATAGQLILSGTSTLANYQNALRAVTYRNTSDSPSTVSRSAGFITSDGIAVGNVAYRTITVTAVNDLPTLSSVSTLTGAQEDTPFAITYAMLAGAANEADVDSATISFRAESVTSGTLTKSGQPVCAGDAAGPGRDVGLDGRGQRQRDFGGLYGEGLGRAYWPRPRQSRSPRAWPRSRRADGIILSSTTVIESRPEGTEVATLSSSDPDPGDSFQYALVGGPTARTTSGSRSPAASANGRAAGLRGPNGVPRTPPDHRQLRSALHHGLDPE